MPGDSRECRQRAARCLEFAATAANDGIKQMFLNLARHWEALAVELERAKNVLDDEKGALRLNGKDNNKKRRKKSAAGKGKRKRKRKSASVMRAKRAKRTNGEVLWGFH